MALAMLACIDYADSEPRNGLPQEIALDMNISLGSKN